MKFWLTKIGLSTLFVILAGGAGYLLCLRGNLWWLNIIILVLLIAILTFVQARRYNEGFLDGMEWLHKLWDK